MVEKSMFQQDLSKTFGRVMGCSASELMGWLEAALPGALLTIHAEDDDGYCRARFEDGDLLIEWKVLASRQIALLSIPQLQVHFQYSGLTLERRWEVQHYFDRATQRGGG